MVPSRSWHRPCTASQGVLKAAAWCSVLQFPASTAFALISFSLLYSIKSQLEDYGSSVALKVLCYIETFLSTADIFGSRRLCNAPIMWELDLRWPANQIWVSGLPGLLDLVWQYICCQCCAHACAVDWRLLGMGLLSCPSFANRLSDWVEL